MKKNLSQIFAIAEKIAFVLAIVCSTSYLLMLGWYNSLLLDDYGFAADVDESGAWGLMRNAYFGWQARFSAFYVLGWILKIWGHTSSLIGYTILLLLLGYVSVYYALRAITHIPNRPLLLGCSMLITNITIMAYLEFSTFYWVCCALYTLSSYAAIVLFTAIFFSNGKIWIRWSLVVVCSLYLCGGAENFTPIVIVSLGCVLLYQMIYQQTWCFWKTLEQQMVLVSILILCAGFIAVILGPSTGRRAINMGETRSFMEHFSVVPFIFQFAKSSSIFILRLLSRSLYYVLLIPIGVIIGRNIPDFSGSEKIGRNILVASLAALGAILLSIAASVFGMGWYASLRAYSFVSFILSALVLYSSALIGQKLSGTIRVNVGLLLSSVLIAAMSICFMRQEQPMVVDYHRQIGRSNALIAEQVQANRTEPLQIEPVSHFRIPNTYAIMRTGLNRLMGKSVLTIAEPSTYFPYEQYGLTTDPDNWKNSDMRRYFNAQFDIIGWEQLE